MGVDLDTGVICYFNDTDYVPVVSSETTETAAGKFNQKLAPSHPHTTPPKAHNAQASANPKVASTPKTWDDIDKAANEARTAKAADDKAIEAAKDIVEFGAKEDFKTVEQWARAATNYRDAMKRLQAAIKGINPDEVRQHFASGKNSSVLNDALTKQF